MSPFLLTQTPAAIPCEPWLPSGWLVGDGGKEGQGACPPWGEVCGMAESGAWLLVLSSVFVCNALKILLPSCSSIISRLLQKDAEQESQMRAEIQNMKQELSTISMMDEFARYARLERRINKMTDKLKTHVKARTAQLAKIKWVINIVFYILQATLMVSLIWRYYAEPVTVLPGKWLAPLERLVAFPTGVTGGVGITCWLVVCNKVVAILLHPFS